MRAVPGSSFQDARRMTYSGGEVSFPMFQRSIVIAFLLLVCACPAQVVINEFNTGSPDFVELRNLSAAAVDVSGWTVATWASQGQTPQPETPFTFAAGTMIAGGGTLVLEENGTAGATGNLGPCAIRTGSNYAWGQSSSIVIALTDDLGGGVDYVYRNATQIPMPPPNLPSGTFWTGNLFSFGSELRRDGDVDNDAAADWASGGSPTPCALNPGQTAPTPVPAVLLALSTMGAGDATFSLTTTPAIPNAEYFGLYSTVDHTPNGSGPFFGLGIDAIPFLYLPLAPNSPFHGTTDAAGGAFVSYPPGSVPIGLFYEGRVAVLDLGAGDVKLSNVVELQL